MGRRREKDGGEVERRGVHPSPQMHWECTEGRSHSHREPAEHQQTASDTRKGCGEPDIADMQYDDEEDEIPQICWQEACWIVISLLRD
ncbi:DNA-directed RNA polymerase II subunit RPB2 isoform X2 [Hippopotamus amphibius kiboko]|uniref:DNA-directed RNA polymerase II subunit RPB2 isoform X2 n=1 Tax=Hippopotamus amphibius kiboko TaxID=575201 RepID=UPI002599BB4C|nr:DNA-directed RNA polymerase II subunit RPB2 isoform X2 [Hippopotamus amphibius kiboko]